MALPQISNICPLQLLFNMLNEHRLHKPPSEEQLSCNLGLLVDQPGPT